MYLSPVGQANFSAGSALGQGTTSDVTAVACDATLLFRLAPAVLAMPWVKNWGGFEYLGDRWSIDVSIEPAE